MFVWFAKKFIFVTVPSKYAGTTKITENIQSNYHLHLLVVHSLGPQQLNHSYNHKGWYMADQL